MYYNECLLILTLLSFNGKLILEIIRKFKEILSSYYKVTSISKKNYTKYPELSLQTREKLKILMSIFEK